MADESFAPATDEICEIQRKL